MLRVNPLTQRVVTPMTEHAHPLQGVDTVNQPEGEPVRDDDPPRCVVEAPVTTPTNRPGPPPAPRPLDVHHLGAPTAHSGRVRQRIRQRSQPSARQPPSTHPPMLSTRPDDTDPPPPRFSPWSCSSWSSPSADATRTNRPTSRLVKVSSPHQASASRAVNPSSSISDRNASPARRSQSATVASRSANATATFSPTLASRRSRRNCSCRTRSRARRARARACCRTN